MWNKLILWNEDQILEIKLKEIKNFIAKDSDMKALVYEKYRLKEKIDNLNEEIEDIENSISRKIRKFVKNNPYLSDIPEYELNRI